MFFLQCFRPRIDGALKNAIKSLYTIDFLCWQSLSRFLFCVQCFGPRIEKCQHKALQSGLLRLAVLAIFDVMFEDSRAILRAAHRWRVERVLSILEVQWSTVPMRFCAFGESAAIWEFDP